MIVRTPGTVSLRHDRPLAPTSRANLKQGQFDGIVQHGQKAIRRAQRWLEDLESLSERPNYLMCLTLPKALEAKEWRKATGYFRAQLSKLLSKHGGGAVWWRGFQQSGRPHLHIYLSINMERSQLLEWAYQQWAKALGSDCPREAVDLKYRSNFNYLRGNHAIDQATAPAADKWGKWAGYMGTWLRLCRQVKETRLEAKLDPGETEELMAGLSELQQNASLPTWLAAILERFLRGYYRAVWVATRYLDKVKSSICDLLSEIAKVRQEKL